MTHAQRHINWELKTILDCIWKGRAKAAGEAARVAAKYAFIQAPHLREE